MSDWAKASGISEQDYQALVHDFNATEDISLLGARLDQLFEQVVSLYPDSIALVHNDTEVSFKELNASANILARCLILRGLKHGDVVGLAVVRSIDLIVVMLAVLKLGAAYVPVDSSFPAERINQMLEDAGPKLILLSDGPAESLARWGGICLKVDDVRDGSITDTSNIGAEIQPHDLAYIIYTSGSTGRPKGVEISHGAAANFLSSLRKYEPGCNEHDRLLAITTISFDMSALELWLPLLSGSTMIMANTSAVKDPRELISLMERHQVTIMQATPATWTMLLELGWKGKPRLSKIICGGEPLSRQLADRLLAAADSVWNVYGPSETTYGSVGRVDEGDIVVGNPVVNGKIYLLDDKMLPVPMGCEGEVYIGGGSVSNGYRNKPELTRSRFIDNPFHGGRFFRTGDLARFIRPGKLQVLGRIDGVVKIRGYRIEVGDIEAVLVDHPSVSQAVVVSRNDRLVAYCVLHVPLEDTTSLESILRPWVAERLPLYMLPAFFVEMGELPLSPNQKVNRNALPDPIEAMPLRYGTQLVSVLEQQLHAIWSIILGHDRIGIQDNFFNIGGDSLRLVRMQAMLETQFHRLVPTPKLFEHYTIKTLAAYLAGPDENDKTQQDRAASHGLPDSNQDIAVISMACRLPGGVVTPEDFWELLQRGGDSITTVPKGRWGADPGADDASDAYRGGFLDSVDSYDASFFGISPVEAQAMDPAQYLMLELCWEAFERAGYTRDQLRGSTTGVFLGVSENVTTRSMAPDLEGYSITGSAAATLSGRVSYFLDLHGPSMTVDTACSSSLAATHVAYTSLLHGECDMALVGGISLLLNQGIHVEFGKLGGLSADGRCKAFSDDADGTGFSEGASMVVLKRLSDAQRDGDDIQAVLRGTAVMHGGHGAGLTVPNAPSQARLIRTALARAALVPDDIGYVEAHGTATKLGDPIEGAALMDVFGRRPCSSDPLWIGTAKSNLGHTQAAAGLVGLLKVVLSMQNNTLPKTIHVNEPTTEVDWASANMRLVLKNHPWFTKESRLRRAGVSSFGIGGTIAHVVIEESPGPAREETAHTTPCTLPTAIPLVLSGDSNAALGAQAEKLRLHVMSGGEKDDHLEDIAYSLATSRTHFHHRWVVMARDKAQLLEALASASMGSAQSCNVNELGTASLAMLFTGQGSQQLGMGKGLYSTYPVFREALDEIASKFAELDMPLLDYMWAEPGSTSASLFHQTGYAQPALFAVEVSLWRLWESWGVKPDFLLGHSVGELAVAHAAGILDLSDACRLVITRSRLMQAVSCHGSMASVEASGAEVTAVIERLSQTGQVHIAGYNTPSQTVVSGDTDAVRVVVAHFTEASRKTKLLDTSHAFHSHHMDSILGDFRAVAQTVQFNPPKIRIISSMTGRAAEEGELERAEYWVQQVRNAVRFSDAFQQLAQQGTNMFVELGPNAVLCGLGAACLADTQQLGSTCWLPSLKPSMDEASTIQHSLGELHARHVPVDWDAYFEPFGCRRVRLPTYAFQRDTVHPWNRFGWMSGTAKANTVNQAADGVEKMMFEMNWRRVPTDKHKAHPPGSWGLVCPAGNTAWTERVQEALLLSGVRLVPITKLQDTQQLDGVLSLWDSVADVVQMAHDSTAEALLQLQEAIRTGMNMTIVWITRHAVGAGVGDQPVGLGAGPLWGLMRTARSEHPELCLRLIDIDGDTDLAILSVALVLDSQTEIVARKGHLLLPHLERASPGAQLAPAAERPLIRADGAVLVTGGLGELGGYVARRLASSHGVCDLVVMSRRGMESPGADAFVAELARLGARATVVAGDVANLDDISSLVQSFTADRPLRGVFHAAGVVDSGTLSSLTPQKCATTFVPKIDGLWNLHQVTEDQDLDVFVMFSSISGILGLPGLGNYAAANSFMDALAHLRRAQGLPATSIAYGTWAGDGMASTLVSTTRTHLSQLGLGLLAPDTGLELLEETVRQGRTLTIAADLDLERLGAYYQEQGGVPPFLCSLLGPAEVEEQGDQAVDLCNMLLDAAPEQRSGIVLHMVREVIAKALGFARLDHVDTRRAMSKFGVDSLTAVLIRNHLTTLTGMALPPNIALLHPNIESLSEFLLARLLDNNVSSSSSTSESNDTAPSSTTWNTPFVDMEAIRRGVLDPSIQFDNMANDTTTCQSTTPRDVLVTGPTGFVGAFMVHEFLQRGISVYCLVRAGSSSLAQQRVIETMKQYSIWKPEYEPKLHWVAGDLSHPLLGLDEVVFDDLASRVDAILHSGALVDWLRPLEDYVRPNILGTHEILRLASRGRGKAVHFISTISTLPIHAGYGLTQDDGEYGYGTSKYLAERMVAAARFRGAKASSYRLPFVAPSTTTGHFRLDQGDFLNNLITGSLDLGAFPLLDADLSAVLPVDYLCSTITAMMIDEKKQQVSEDYDFINAHAPTFKQFFAMIGLASGNRETVLFSEWRRRAFEYAAAHPKSALARITAVVDGYTDETASHLFKGAPVGRHVLGRDLYPSPLIDEEYVLKYLSCISAVKGRT
ncbi:hypothetical protein F66182_4985 [Fusarium sp. NRRL 66182]|nr:hypothetical protein F66182_4985 [Fusarium sp. NRRL 66182]